MKVIHFLPVVLLIFTSSGAFSQTNNDSLLQVLRKAIEVKDSYMQPKLQRIEKLTGQLQQTGNASLEEQFDLYNKLYHEYKVFIYDSAFRYAKKLIETAYQLNDKSKIGYARVKLGFILISSGMFKETFDSLTVVEVKYLPDTTRLDHYRLIARAYTDLNIYNTDHFYTELYRNLNLQYMDSALALCEPESYYYYYYIVVKEIQENNYHAVINAVEELLKRHTLTDPQLAVNYHDLANAYNALNEPEKNIHYLALSALSDIRASTKETASMYTLAKFLFEKGDIKNSYIFIKQALDDAEFYGARQRKVQIGSVLPLIAAAELMDSESRRMLWLRYVIGLSILSILVMAFAIIIFKQLRKLKAAEKTIVQANESLRTINQKLREADAIKEEYIGYYFNINSEYLDKIEGFKKSVEKYLTARKTDEIRFIVNNIDLRKEREELYYSFDKVFLKLFPDFVTTFNSYFHEADRIVLKDNQLLNTELRIFALIRMGIHDSEKIARILNYSVNTIYSYKNRVKSKSFLPNEEFERKIMEIQTVRQPV